ncbi:MAG: hypothetical protein L6R36_005560 [Xanthoria steineri]|nr:MAG: hypothetical protein L6R36_005560 [Xanthoria steineri]
MDEPPLTSFSVTHISYDASDPIAYICAWLALVPQILCVVYATLIWSSREVEIFLMFAGQMGCEVLNFLLKRMIKGERPPRIKSKGYGMPSSHAQFVAFFSVYLTLFLLFRHKPHPSDTHTPTTLAERLLLAAWSFVFAATVCASRVYLQYHTVNQVLVGSLVGALTAVAWFGVTTMARRKGWIQRALESRALMMLRVRDLVVEEDLAESGWERWKNVSRRRQLDLRNQGSVKTKRR